MPCFQANSRLASVREAVSLPASKPFARARAWTFPSAVERWASG